MERDGGVFEWPDTDVDAEDPWRGGCSGGGGGGGGGGALPNGTEAEGRGDGSVSTGDTIIANEGDNVCCIARASVVAGGNTGVCGCRRACFGDREPDAEPGPGPEEPWGMSGGVGESSANLRFLPPCGDTGSGAGCGSGASERHGAAGVGVMLCHWLDQGGGGGTWCPLDDGCRASS